MCKTPDTIKKLYICSPSPSPQKNIFTFINCPQQETEIFKKSVLTVSRAGHFNPKDSCKIQKLNQKLHYLKNLLYVKNNPMYLFVSIIESVV